MKKVGDMKLYSFEELLEDGRRLRQSRNTRARRI